MKCTEIERKELSIQVVRIRALLDFYFITENATLSAGELIQSTTRDVKCTEIERMGLSIQVVRIRALLDFYFITENANSQCWRTHSKYYKECEMYRNSEERIVNSSSKNQSITRFL